MGRSVGRNLTRWVGMLFVLRPNACWRALFYVSTYEKLKHVIPPVLTAVRAVRAAKTHRCLLLCALGFQDSLQWGKYCSHLNIVNEDKSAKTRAACCAAGLHYPLYRDTNMSSVRKLRGLTTRTEMRYECTATEKESWASSMRFYLCAQSHRCLLLV